MPQNGWHRTHPERWESVAWITLEAIVVSLCFVGVVASVYALSVLAGAW